MEQKSGAPASLGYIYGLITAAIWASNYIVARDLSDVLGPISLAFGRWTVALIVVFPLAIRPLLRERSLIVKNLPYLLLVSLCGVTVFNTLVYIAAQSTSAINLSLIAITSPIFIIIISRILYGEKITFAKIVGIIIVIFGVFLLFTEADIQRVKELSYSPGDLWMFVAAFVFAMYSSLLKKTPVGISPLSFQLITFTLGILALFPLFLYELSHTPLPHISLGTAGSICYLGVFASFVAYLLWSKAIKIVGPTAVGMIYYSIPLFSAVMAYIFLGEDIEFIHFVAGAFIVGGIVVASYKKKS